MRIHFKIYRIHFALFFYEDSKFINNTFARRIENVYSRKQLVIHQVLTGNINDLFIAQDKLLKEQIDVLMLFFQFTQPNFYNSYKKLIFKSLFNKLL